MQHKRLVLDANILIRGVLGQQVRHKIEQASDNVAFYVAESNFLEAEQWLAELAPHRGLTESVWRPALASLMHAVQLVGQEELALVEAEARARIGQRDERDWPGVAAAILLNYPIWTEDRDFFGAGIPTWMTQTVDLYLKSP